MKRQLPLRYGAILLATATPCARAALAGPMVLTPGYGGAANVEFTMNLPPSVWGPLLVLALGCALWLLSLALTPPRRRPRGAASPWQRGVRGVRRWLGLRARQPRPAHAAHRPGLAGGTRR